MNALTVIVAQDPHRDWFHEVIPQPLEALDKQLETVLAGIGVDSAKTGMLGSIEVIELVADKVKQYGIDNLVVDPVMVCKGADEALHPEIDACLRDVLVPHALVVTPNLFEASQISGLSKVTTVEEMKEAAARIQEQGAKYVIVKGGKLSGHDKAVDVLFDGNDFTLLESDIVPTSYTHGAGCTFSAAITAELAKGSDVMKAIETAKAFITAAIKHSSRLNQYVGSVNHGGYRKSLGQ